MSFFSTLWFVIPARRKHSGKKWRSHFPKICESRQAWNFLLKPSIQGVSINSYLKVPDKSFFSEFKGLFFQFYTFFSTVHCSRLIKCTEIKRQRAIKYLVGFVIVKWDFCQAAGGCKRKSYGACRYWKSLSPQINECACVRIRDVQMKRTNDSERGNWVTSPKRERERKKDAVLSFPLIVVRPICRRRRRRKSSCRQRDLASKWMFFCAFLEPRKVIHYYVARLYSKRICVSRQQSTDIFHVLSECMSICKISLWDPSVHTATPCSLLPSLSTPLLHSSLLICATPDCIHFSDPISPPLSWLHEEEDKGRGLRIWDVEKRRRREERGWMSSSHPKLIFFFRRRNRSGKKEKRKKGEMNGKMDSPLSLLFRMVKRRIEWGGEKERIDFFLSFRYLPPRDQFNKRTGLFFEVLELMKQETLLKVRNLDE